MIVDEAVEATASKKYFLGSLPGLVDEESLCQYMSKFGQVYELDVIRKKKSKLCKGYAFVTMKLHMNEIDFLNTRHIYQDRQIFIRWYMKGDDLYHNKSAFLLRRLFINKVPSWLSSYDLIDYFGKFGHIEHAYIAPNYGTHKSESYIGFVNFVDNETLNKVLSIKDHFIKGIKVNCQPFVDKKAKLTKGPGPIISKVHSGSTHESSYGKLPLVYSQSSQSDSRIKISNTISSMLHFGDNIHNTSSTIEQLVHESSATSTRSPGGSIQTHNTLFKYPGKSLNGNNASTTTNEITTLPRKRPLACTQIIGLRHTPVNVRFNLLRPASYYRGN